MEPLWIKPTDLVADVWIRLHYLLLCALLIACSESSEPTPVAPAPVQALVSARVKPQDDIDPELKIFIDDFFDAANAHGLSLHRPIIVAHFTTEDNDHADYMSLNSGSYMKDSIAYLYVSYTVKVFFETRYRSPVYRALGHVMLSKPFLTSCDAEVYDIMCYQYCACGDSGSGPEWENALTKLFGQ